MSSAFTALAGFIISIGVLAALYWYKRAEYIRTIEESQASPLDLPFFSSERRLAELRGGTPQAGTHSNNSRQITFFQQESESLLGPERSRIFLFSSRGRAVLPSDVPLSPGGTVEETPSLLQMFYGVQLVGSPAFARGEAQLSFGSSWLTEKGLVQVPFIVRTPREDFPLLLFRDSGVNASAVFQAVTEEGLLRGLAYPSYYAARELPVEKSVAPLQLLEPSRFSRDGNGLKVPRAFFWGDIKASPDQVRNFCEEVTATYDVIAGVDSYLFAQFLKSHDAVRAAQGALRVSLPDTLVALDLAGPDGQSLTVSFSCEKGIRLHFPQAADSLRAITLYWVNLRLYAENLKNLCRDHSFPLDEDDAEQRYSWWTASRAELENRLTGGNLEEFALAVLSPHETAG